MNENIIKGLRAALAFIENNSDINFEEGDSTPVQLHYRTWCLPNLSAERKRTAAIDVIKRLGGGEKSWGGEFFSFIHEFAPGVTFTVHAERQDICERVVVGKKTVPASKEIVLSAIPEREVDIVEWRCAPLLAHPEQTLTSGA
jgi:hypothetical protein